MYKQLEVSNKEKDQAIAVLEDKVEILNGEVEQLKL